MRSFSMDFGVRSFNDMFGSQTNPGPETVDFYGLVTDSIRQQKASYQDQIGTFDQTMQRLMNPVGDYFGFPTNNQTNTTHLIAEKNLTNEIAPPEIFPELKPNTTNIDTKTVTTIIPVQVPQEKPTMPAEPGKINIENFEPQAPGKAKHKGKGLGVGGIPPGIQKKMESGNLPPGLAKKFPQLSAKEN